MLMLGPHLVGITTDQHSHHSEHLSLKRKINMSLENMKQGLPGLRFAALLFTVCNLVRLMPLSLEYAAEINVDFLAQGYECY